MPELPEVETIRVGLQKYLVGHVIQAVDVRMQKQLSGNTADVIGAKITNVKPARPFVVPIKKFYIHDLG